MVNTDFSIRSFKGGYDQNFLYLLSCMRTGAQVVVDPALPLKTIQPFLHGSITAVLVTHTHGDHIAYLDEYIKKYPDCLVIVHEISSGMINASNVHPAQDHEQIRIGELEINIIFTPGHYFDSLCFLVENVLFTGDTLFVGRTGRTISSRSDIKKLFRSVYLKLLTLPHHTIIYPGHDYGQSPTISLQKNIQISPLLQAKNEQDFIQRMALYEASRNEITKETI